MFLKFFDAIKHVLYFGITGVTVTQKQLFCRVRSHAFARGCNVRLAAFQYWATAYEDVLIS
jgi:hypothetical protein